MTVFMGENFLLRSDAARELYHRYALEMPIFDYHCHLNPQDIAEDRQFENLSQIWLEGDHYKWRTLRAAGVSESLITGNSSDYNKYLAWAQTVPKTLGNPLYHWTHLELKRPFGIAGKLFGPETAEAIWHSTKEQLATPAFSARGIMQQMKVKMVGTTDDPVSDLRYHRQLASDPTFDISVLPSWRPDRAFKIELDGFADYLRQLAEAAGCDIHSWESLLTALTRRLDHFDAHGCRAADHGIEVIRFAPVPSETTLTGVLQRRLQGQTLDESEVAGFTTAVLVWLGQQYAKRGWVMQYHIGALRNTNSRMFRLAGADSGFDSIGDRTYALELSLLLDAMDQTDELPKTILYCLNPRDNEMLAALTGNFQGGGIAGKIQFGSGWWYNDQKDGMQRQLEQLSQLGLLSQFVGMLTDSRSFLSYTRHEYFRRILCNMLGNWMEQGEIPHEMAWVGEMVQNISFNNARRYFAKG